MTESREDDPQTVLRARAVSERRKYQRLEVRLPVEMHRRPNDPSPLSGTTIDVSPFGMKALMHSPCDEDEAVEVSVALPGKPMKTGAIVVRCKPEGRGYRVSFAFYRLDLEQFTRLRDFVDRPA